MAKNSVGVRKRGDRWNASIEIKGKFRSRTFDTKMEAELWRAEQKIFLQNSKKIITGKTFGDACDRYGVLNPLSKTGFASHRGFH